MFPGDAELCLCVCVCSYHYTTASPIKYLSDFHWPMKVIIHQPSEHHGWLVLKASLQPWSVEHIKRSLWKALTIFWNGSTAGLNEAFRTSENQMALQDHFWMFGSESFVCRRLHKLAIWVAGSRLGPAFQTAHLCLQLRRQYCKVPQKYYSIYLYV